MLPKWSPKMWVPASACMLRVCRCVLQPLSVSLWVLGPNEAVSYIPAWSTLT